MLRFIHITDTHIARTESIQLYERSPLQYLRRLVEEINALPFPIAFVLHTGDVADDKSAEAYALYNEAIDDLAFPVHHLVGNHDDVRHLQQIVMGIDPPADRLDYTFDAGGVRFVALDTRSPLEPGGRVEPDQLDWLAEQVGVEHGPPLVIAMHHAVVPLDTPWLDVPPPGWNGRYMFTENAAAVRQVLAPARERIRCVLSGHVHGMFTVQRDGILYVPGQSVFAPLANAPHLATLTTDPNPHGHYSLVSISEDGQTIIRPRTFTV